MLINSNNSKLINLFYKYLSVAYFILALTPILNRNFLIIIIIISLLILLLYLYTLFKSSFILKGEKHVVFIIFIWLIYIFLYKITGYSTASIGNYVKQVTFFTPFIIFAHHYRTRQFSTLKTYSYIILFIVSVISLHNIILDINFPDVLSVITSEHYSDYLKYNFALTSFTFISAMCSNVLFYILNRRKSIIFNFFVVIGIFLTFYFTYISGRATSFILMIVFFPLTYYLKLLRSKKKSFIFQYKIAYFTILTIIALIILYNHNYFISLINNDRIETRIYSLLKMNEVNNSSLARLDLMNMSINTWLSNFITFTIGIGFHQVANSYTIGVGQHSGFIDLLGYYGILGFILNISIYLLVYKYFKSLIIDKYNKRFFTISFILLICYNLLNNIVSMDISIYVFTLLPSIAVFYSYKNKMRGEKK